MSETLSDEPKNTASVTTACMPSCLTSTRSGRTTTRTGPSRPLLSNSTPVLELHPALAPLAFEQGGLADEIGNEQGFGMVIDVGRTADLFDPALIHHRHQIGERESLALGHASRR